MVLSVADDHKVVLSVAEIRADAKRNKAPFSSKQTKNAYRRHWRRRGFACAGDDGDEDDKQLSCMQREGLLAVRQHRRRQKAKDDDDDQLSCMHGSARCEGSLGNYVLFW